MEFNISCVVYCIIFLPVIYGRETYLFQFRKCSAYNNKRFIAAPLNEVKTTHIYLCIGICGSDNQCSFVVYNWETKLCSCHEKRDITSPTVENVDMSTLYYDGKILNISMLGP